MEWTTTRTLAQSPTGRSRLRQPAFAILIVVLMLAAAACGSSSSKPTQTPVVTRAATAQTSSSAPASTRTAAATTSLTAPVASPPIIVSRLATPATPLPAPSPTPTVAAAGQPSATSAPVTTATGTEQAANGSGDQQPNAAFRAVNWKTVLSNDPNFQVDPKLGALLPDIGGVYLTYKRAKLDVSGYPDLTSIQYGDLGDGRQSAVIPVISGGTSGITGVLVYQIPAGAALPKFVDALGGYNLAIIIQGGNLHDLQLTKPIYNGWEPNCCPSGLEYVPYKLEQGKLAQTGDYISPAPGAIVMTVEHFYDLLASKQYKEAYAFFTPEFQQANPYQSWLAGYANTQQITAHVAPLSNNQVTVNIQAVDQPPGGAKVTKQFSGTWTLDFAAGPYQWFLDKANIQQVP